MGELIELKGELDRYLVYNRMIYRIRKNSITKMFPLAEFTETVEYDNEHNLLEAIDEIQENHSNDTSGIGFLAFNDAYNSIHYSASGGYYVAQFYNMIIVFNIINDKILYVTDFGNESETSASINSSADGKILCIKKYKNIKFINTDSWELIGEKSVSETFYNITFSPTGYKMILGSDQGYAWIWDLKDKIKVSHKFSGKEKIGQTGFFINENRVGLWDRNHSEFRFYDLNDDITELQQKVSHACIPFFSLLFNDYILVIMGYPRVSLLKIDKQQLKLVEEISLSKELILLSNPTAIKEEDCFIFSEFIFNRKAVTTNVIKYDIKHNTYNCLKTVKGHLTVIAYIKNEMICRHDKQIVRYNLEK